MVGRNLLIEELTIRFWSKIKSASENDSISFVSGFWGK